MVIVNTRFTQHQCVTDAIGRRTWGRPGCLRSWENAHGSILAKVEGAPCARRVEGVCPRTPAERREAWLRGGKLWAELWGQDRSDLRAAWSWDRCLECVWIMDRGCLWSSHSCRESNARTHRFRRNPEFGPRRHGLEFLFCPRAATWLWNSLWPLRALSSCSEEDGIRIAPHRWMGRAFPCPSSHHEHAFQMTVIHVDLYHLSQKSTFFQQWQRNTYHLQNSYKNHCVVCFNKFNVTLYEQQEKV